MQRTVATTWILLLGCLAAGGCVQSESSPQETVYPILQPAPDQIAFVSTRDNGSGTIYTVNSDGTGLTRVTPLDLVAVFPRWMPSLWPSAQPAMPCPLPSLL